MFVTPSLISIWKLANYSVDVRLYQQYLYTHPTELQDQIISIVKPLLEGDWTPEGILLLLRTRTPTELLNLACRIRCGIIWRRGIHLEKYKSHLSDDKLPDGFVDFDFVNPKEYLFTYGSGPFDLLYSTLIKEKTVQIDEEIFTGATNSTIPISIALEKAHRGSLLYGRIKAHFKNGTDLRAIEFRAFDV
jgi:hypothetical protein